MILLILLTLLFCEASGADQDKWECGPDSKWAERMELKKLSKMLVGQCHATTQDHANLCCKDHDLCYDIHNENHFNQTHCDKKFCHCLQDATDRAKDYPCRTELHAFCSSVITFGNDAFDNVKLDEHKELSAAFSDKKPLGLEMKKLVDTCRYSKKLAIHCHDSTVKCLANPHERNKRDFNVVSHSYEDCHSTMYDCLQTLIESGARVNCTTIARNLSKKVLVYTELNELLDGKAIVDTYPVIASRLLQRCNESTHALETCFVSFDECAKQNRQENPEQYNAARRIKIVCHQDLRRCVTSATSCESKTNKDCTEANLLAVSLIREVDLEPEKKLTKASLDIVNERIGEVYEVVEEKFDAGKEKMKTIAQPILEKAGKVIEPYKKKYESIGEYLETKLG